MNNKFKKTTLTLALVSAFGLTSNSYAEGALSANVGFSSDYVYRGVLQADASASAGADYENSGFYVGTWFADVDLGLEYDLYGGYGGEFSGISYDLNYTAYLYTDDAFDDTYQEINIGLGYGPISLGYADGTYDNYEGKTPGNKSQDYSVTTLTAEYNGFFATLGDYGKDSTGSWYELGYGTEINGFDAGITIISSDKDLDKQEYLVFSLGKSFDL